MPTAFSAYSASAAWYSASTASSEAPRGGRAFRSGFAPANCMNSRSGIPEGPGVRGQGFGYGVVQRDLRGPDAVVVGEYVVGQHPAGELPTSQRISTETQAAG